MSILGTAANYTVTVPVSPSEEDPFELVQGAHFMQLLLAQLRPRDPLDTKKHKDVLEQLARINLLQEIDDPSELVNASGPAGNTAAPPKEEDQS